MASAEGGSVPNGVGYGEGCPLSSQLSGERRELPRGCSGQSPGRKQILAYFEGHRTLLFVSIWQKSEGTICSSVPLLQILGDLSPASPRDLRRWVQRAATPPLWELLVHDIPRIDIRSPEYSAFFCSTVGTSGQHNPILAHLAHLTGETSPEVRCQQAMPSHALTSVAMVTDPMTPKQTRHHASYVSHYNAQLCILGLTTRVNAFNCTYPARNWLHLNGTAGAHLSVPNVIQISKFLRPLCIVLDVALTSNGQLNTNCIWQRQSNHQKR